ncbi:hypothetical protein BJ742DRAFT_743475 [Cladochytrium replicatum]|nr:hypothetical protein BJ742DRAFT_743475 [Cladochytrium replicatum]
MKIIPALVLLLLSHFLFPQATGWGAFGIANTTDADIVVWWNNGGFFVISDCTVTGDALSSFDSVHAISLVASPATLDPSHTVKISYTRQVAATADKAVPSGSSSFIHAISNTTVSDPTDSSSGLTQRAATQFTADLSAQSSWGPGSATGTTRQSTTRSTATVKASPTKISDAAPGTSKTVGLLFLGLLCNCNKKLSRKFLLKA